MPAHVELQRVMKVPLERHPEETFAYRAVCTVCPSADFLIPGFMGETYLRGEPTAYIEALIDAKEHDHAVHQSA